MCGSPLPSNRGSRACSMCYGDIGHGKDGYYEEWARQDEAARTMAGGRGAA